MRSCFTAWVICFMPPAGPHLSPLLMLVCRVVCSWSVRRHPQEFKLLFRRIPQANKYAMLIGFPAFGTSSLPARSSPLDPHSPTRTHHVLINHCLYWSLCRNDDSLMYLISPHIHPSLTPFFDRRAAALHLRSLGGQAPTGRSPTAERRARQPRSGTARHRGETTWAHACPHYSTSRCSRSPVVIAVSRGLRWRCHRRPCW